MYICKLYYCISCVINLNLYIHTLLHVWLQHTTQTKWSTYRHFSYTVCTMGISFMWLTYIYTYPRMYVCNNHILPYIYCSITLDTGAYVSYITFQYGCSRENYRCEVFQGNFFLSIFGPYNNNSFFIRFTKQTLHRHCSYVYSVRIKLKAHSLNSIFAKPLFVMNLTINRI